MCIRDRCKHCVCACACVSLSENIVFSWHINKLCSTNVMSRHFLAYTRHVSIIIHHANQPYWFIGLWSTCDLVKINVFFIALLWIILLHICSQYLDFKNFICFVLICIWWGINFFSVVMFVCTVDFSPIFIICLCNKSCMIYVFICQGT